MTKILPTCNHGNVLHSVVILLDSVQSNKMVEPKDCLSLLFTSRLAFICPQVDQTRMGDMSKSRTIYQGFMV